MKRVLCLSIMLGSLFLFALMAQAQTAAQTALNSYKISGPLKCDNLSIFFIHGADQQKGQHYLTLQEALADKKVVVHETGSVNQLSIDNLSDAMVFIQSGDIVKGGRQDRAMQSDLLIPPKTMNMPLPAFCVEQSRWHKRGKEESNSFNTSNCAVAGKAVKLAAKQLQDQGAVWRTVSQYQDKLKENAGFVPTLSPSPSSYQLTLEDKNVQGSIQHIINTLEKEGPTEKSDVIGYAFAVNGSINSADVYASNALFRKLWPKLLKASAVEAVAERKAKQIDKPVTDDDVRRSLAAAEAAPKSPKYYASKADFEILPQENDSALLFSTVDKRNKVSVHKSFITK